MIQLTWLELLFIFFSALVGGSLLFNFKFRGFSIDKRETENLEEELIDPAAKQRLRKYDLNETVFQVQGNSDDQIAELKKKVQDLEEQINLLKENKPENFTSKSDNNDLIADEENDQEEEPAELSEEDQYLQAKEEMELVLFKAQRQLTRYDKALQDQNNLSSAEASINNAENIFRTEFTKRAQVIDQLRHSFQKNPHTTFSLCQMKKRVLEEMEALSTAADNVEAIKI
jgi:hypothetical protein